jgi:putative nucleotidyltransferase with HDIG domain
MMERAAALAFLRRHTAEESQIRHALAVEAAMRHFARIRGEDEAFWAMVGLLHDIDYGEHPDEHLKHARSMLTAEGFPEALIRAVENHGWGICSEVEPLHVMEKALYAVDELTGFIAACAYVRPSRSVLDLEPKSVLKKWKAKEFAAAVRRDVIESGAAMLGMGLEDLIAETIEAMRAEANTLGLAGTGA